MKINRLLVLVAALMLGFEAMAQSGGIMGRVVSRGDRQAVAGATVTVEPLGTSVVVRNDGSFTLGGLQEGVYTVNVKAEGYEPESYLVRVKENMRDMNMLILVPAELEYINDAQELIELDAEGLDVLSYNSPVASSKDLFSYIGEYNFSEMRFNARGIDGEDVYLNGVYLGDALNGYSPWSLWTGLNDATRNQEHTSGFKAGNYGVGGAGGSTNINARASQMRKGFRASLVNSSGSYRFRVMATYASGMLDNGWSYGFSVSTRQGSNSWVDGVYYNTWAYFGSAEKRWGDRHNLALTIFGTPTQRSAQMASTEEAYSLLGNNFYNPNWGYLNGKMRNARVRNNHEPVVNLAYTYSAPNKKTTMTASAVYRFGRNGYSALDWYNAQDPRPDYYRNLPSFYLNEGQGKRFFQQNAGMYSMEEWQQWGEFDSSNPEKFAHLYNIWSSDNRAFTQLDWNRMYNINRGYTNNDDNVIPDGVQVGQSRSKYVIEERRTDQQDFNLNYKIDHRFSQNHSVTGGVSYRMNRTEYYKILKDLLGGSYWIDIDQYADRDFGDDQSMQNDLARPNRAVYEGDKYGYDYYAHIHKARLWGAYNYNSSLVNAYAAAEIGYTSFWREGLVEKGLFPTANAKNVGETSLGCSEKQNFLTYRIKAGADFKVDGRNTIGVNGFYLNDAPYFQYSFVSPRTRNAVTPGLTTEKYYGGEVTYTANYSFMKLRLAGYFVQNNDQVKVISFYDDVNRAFTNFAMSGIDQRHAGVEFAVSVPIAVGISFEGAVNYGDYVYTSDPLVTQTVDNNAKAVLENARVYYKGLKVESTPQTAATLGFDYKGPNSWYAGINVNLYDRTYLSMNPLYRTKAALTGRAQFDSEGNIAWDKMDEAQTTWTREMMGQEEVTGYGNCPINWTLNANVSKVWSIKRKYQLGVSLELKNITNNKHLRTGGYEQTRLRETTENGLLQYNKYASKYFYLYGFNYYLNIYFRF
ncbi:MAG: carboxypeptidase-like regulatory domain-containing protein [Rikenellaceae bacterium]|nr:carboxypeptidase-like regulatory domain-containing protein [Rikenellaceae bacterium]